MKSTLILPVVLLYSYSTFGQVLDNSFEGIEQKETSYISLNIEINQQKIDSSMNIRFYAKDGVRVYQSRFIRNDKYKFDELVDSAKLIVEIDSMLIESSYMCKSYINNGGSLLVGYCDNILELYKRWRRSQKKENFDKKQEIGEFYLRMVKDKTIIRDARKNRFKAIEFLHFKSSCDCGTVIKSSIRLIK